ncbi:MULTISPECIES: helix-turn-helix transcriptional regulator [Paenibacillus]|uniref:HTH cro/C1-type domain-containing protein n=1 Tax=Paenibacillus ehimensis TaxID=79264 RepID=A0ABT8VI74_9BACL|nr:MULTISPECIES: helix-turn-helix domain-containing protein [Paenibacillus]MBU7319036.1 hypothetical protein [Paenibacillus oleatilyticus]MDO3680668.1 hypothetical protein [Paenibacillus ehimensis]
MEERAKRRPKAIPLKKDRPLVPRLRFRELRIAKCSQNKMASDLNVTEITIRKIEYGQLDPSFMMSFVYAAYLGSTVEELFPDIVDGALEYYETLKEKFQ